MYQFQNSPEYEPDEYELWFYYGREPTDKSKIKEWEKMLERREKENGNTSSSVR